MTIDDVVAVASGQIVRLDPECARRLDDARVAVLRAARSEVAVYGLTTGVGALREVAVEQDEVRAFNRRLILSHRVSHGNPVPHSVVRATMICRAQGLAVGGALDEEAGLVLRLAAIELVCGAQAVDLRKRWDELGDGTRAIYAFVRSSMPFVGSDETAVTDLEDFVGRLEAEWG
jgi:histidine ammonia-lyase